MIDLFVYVIELKKDGDEIQSGHSLNCPYQALGLLILQLFYQLLALNCHCLIVILLILRKLGYDFGRFPFGVLFEFTQDLMVRLFFKPDANI